MNNLANNITRLGCCFILFMVTYCCHVNKPSSSSVLERKITFSFHGVENHVQWQSEAEWQANSDTIEVRINAKIDEGWHLYSQNLESDEGPLPTVFQFNKSDSCVFHGKVFEGTAKEEYDRNFGMNVRFFQDRAIFTQRIVRTTEESFTVIGKVNYMVCDNEKCLPPIDLNLLIQVGQK